MKRTLHSITALLAVLALSACAAGGYIDAGDGGAHHVAKCPKGTECVSTLKVGAAALGSSGFDSKPMSSSGWKGSTPANKSAWQNPDAGPAKVGVKLDSERNIFILRKQEPVAVKAPAKIEPVVKGGPAAKPVKPKSDAKDAKPSEAPAPPKADEGPKKAASASGGPPPKDVIPPPKDIRPKG